MKNGFLKLLCAFSIFLFVGLTSGYAQDYVSRTEAMTIITDLKKDVLESVPTDGKLEIQFLNNAYQNLENGQEVTRAVKMAFQNRAIEDKVNREKYERFATDLFEALKR